jgi:hypothetical protein
VPVERWLWFSYTEYAPHEFTVTKIAVSLEEMSEVDVQMKEWIATYGWILFVIVLAFYLTRGYLFRARNK